MSEALNEMRLSSRCRSRHRTGVISTPLEKNKMLDTLNMQRENIIPDTLNRRRHLHFCKSAVVQDIEALREEHNVRDIKWTEATFYVFGEKMVLETLNRQFRFGDAVKDIFMDCGVVETLPKGILCKSSSPHVMLAYALMYLTENLIGLMRIKSIEERLEETPFVKKSINKALTSSSNFSLSLISMEARSLDKASSWVFSVQVISYRLTFSSLLIKVRSLFVEGLASRTSLLARRWGKLKNIVEASWRQQLGQTLATGELSLLCFFEKNHYHCSVKGS
ncbi:hypothetical protein V6N11_013068 [Hibiscus sabdariffa]|uniref:Uncharacterized protein n=1 Tax=Hibiscus sabdariffa TaxID=183260 RepID=A0ABR2A637_9ROSI